MNLRERADGRGTITFGNDNNFAYAAFGRGWPGANRQMAPAFEGVAGAREIARIIREAQRAARGG